MQRANSLEKTFMLGKIEDRKKRGKQDEMVGWHHWLNGHEFEQTQEDSKGQGSLVCCSPWGHKELDTSEWLNKTKTWNGEKIPHPWNIFHLSSKTSIYDQFQHFAPIPLWAIIEVNTVVESGDWMTRSNRPEAPWGSLSFGFCPIDNTTTILEIFIKLDRECFHGLERRKKIHPNSPFNSA